MGSVKTFSQFYEAAIKGITITFGRFQPPTTGHGKLLDRVAAEAGSSPHRIYASQSADGKSNPLEYDEKIKIMRAMFPRHARSIIQDSAIRTVLDAAASAYKDGFTRLTLVVGGDRVAELSELMHRYDGVKRPTGFYAFPDGINVVSAGGRDPDAEGVEGMSGSKMRAAVTGGNIKAFASGLPAGYDGGKDLFALMRKRMKLPELVNFREHVRLSHVSDIREKFVMGEAFPINSRAMIVATNEGVTIVGHGPNYVLTRADDGSTKRRWLEDLKACKETGVSLPSPGQWASAAFMEACGRESAFRLSHIDRFGNERLFETRQEISEALAAIGKLNPKYKESFHVRRNSGSGRANAVTFREVAWIPNFHIP